MADEMDELDRQIIDILQTDGRLPIAQLADRVGLSRPAVAERIDKLGRSGVIAGTTAVVDPSAIGLGITAFISARQSGLPHAHAERELERLLERDEIREAHSVAGEDCYLLKVRTDSIASLNRIVSEISGPPLMMTTRTTIVMETHCEKVGGVVLKGGRR